MKFLICAFALVAVAFAAPQHPDHSTYTKDGHARILVQESDQDINGNYKSRYETENGIIGFETAIENNGIQSQGGYQYNGDDGKVHAVSWSAGEQGFVAQGDDLPVGPPIPEEILRGLAWNAAHPEEEKEWDPENYKPVQPAYIGQPAYTGRK